MTKSKIPDHPDYSVSDTGQIFHTVDGKDKELNPYTVKGRKYVTLYRNGRKIKKTKAVHKLVAEAFLGKPKGFHNPIIGFKDGNPLMCQASNLQWIESTSEYVPKVKDNQQKVWTPGNWKFAIGDCISQHVKRGHALTLRFEEAKPRIKADIEEACKFAGITVSFAE